MNYDHAWAPLHTLTLLAQLGSFTAVAQRLGISKATVSQRIQALEQQMGQALVHRSTRALRLTEAGQALVQQAQPALDALTQALLSTLQGAGQPRGTVRLTAPVALGRQVVAPLLVQFSVHYPEVQVHLDLSDTLVTLAHEGVDLAIRHVSHPPDQHVARRLGGSRSWLVASPQWLDQKGAPSHPRELQQWPCLTYLRPGPVQWSFEPASGGKRVQVPIGSAWRANNSEVLRTAAEAGLGLAQLPDFSVTEALATGRLQVVMPRWRPVGFFGEALYLLRPAGVSPPKTVQLLWQFIQQNWGLSQLDTTVLSGVD